MNKLILFVLKHSYTNKVIYMIAMSQKTTKNKQEQIGTNKHYIGIDSGNGFLKAFSDKGLSTKIPSYICLPKAETENNIIDKEGCSVLYFSGVRADLIGKRFLIGSPAYSTSPQGKLEIAQLDKGKVDYGLHLLLGAIGCMGFTQCDLNINLCVSIHHAKNFRDELTKAIYGHHSVELGGKAYNINIDKILVVNEGGGTLAALLANGRVQKSNKMLLLDLGYGTSISSIYQFGKQIDRNVMTFGVRDLYQAIAKHPNMIKERNGKEGDSYIIREGIENKSFQYGNYKPFSFAGIYKECLQAWSSENLRTTLSDLKEQIDSANCMFAVGGGSCLPMVDKHLQSKGFQVLPNSHTLNAEGLLLLAKNKLGE